MLSGRRAQVWRHHPDYLRPRHFHCEPELNFVVRGRARVAVGDRSFELGSGDFLVFQPGQDHQLLRASSDLELFVAALRPELAERVGCLSASAVNSRARLTENEVVRVSAELGALGAVADGAAIERSLSALFMRISGQLAKGHVLSRRALAELHANPAISGGQLAARLKAGPSDVSRRFHGDTGVRLVEYRARLRLMRFIALVDRGESLSHAALNADFGSYAQCHRVFQRALGCAPQHYFASARQELDERLAR